MRLISHVTHGLKDPATGRIVVEKRMSNTVNALGRSVFWKLMTGQEPDDGPPATLGRITGTSAILRLGTGGTNTVTLDEPSTGFPSLFASPGRHARIIWRWDDTDLTAVYTAESADLFRDLGEGVLAHLDIAAGDRIDKVSGLQYYLTWQIYLRSGKTSLTGTGAPAERVSAGLLEVLRPVVESPNAVLSEQFLRAALIADITPAHTDSTEAVVILSNFRTSADDATIPANALRFDARVDPEQITGDRDDIFEFTARGLALRLQWGVEDDQGMMMIQSATIVLLDFVTAVTVSRTAEEWERDYTLQLLDATGVANPQP